MPWDSAGPGGGAPVPGGMNLFRRPAARMVSRPGLRAEDGLDILAVAHVVVQRTLVARRIRMPVSRQVKTGRHPGAFAAPPSGGEPAVFELTPAPPQRMICALAGYSAVW